MSYDDAIGGEIHWGDELTDLEFQVPEDPFEVPAEEVAQKALAEGKNSAPLLNLPEEFWGSRQLFKDVRQAAHATINSGDAVFASVLARASAMVSHDIKFDSGRGPKGSLNLFVSLVAKSGVGKSTAVACADDLIQAPAFLSRPDGTSDPDRFRDGVGLGTGEGMAEAYMGMATRETNEVDRRGNPKTESYRAQVRHNAFLYLDEGQTLTKMMKERQGTTIGATIRTAWTGGALGQANAQETTTRYVARGAYAMGMVIGYQPSVAQDLLSDGGPGTPQRFLWFSATDPSIPEDGPQLPEPFRLPLETSNGLPLAGIIEFPAEYKRKLRMEHLGKSQGTAEVEELDSHAPLMLCKLAALLCLLDQRWMVSEEDLALADMIWAVSCANRDRLIEFGRQQEALEREKKIAAKVDEVEATSLATREVDSNIDRVARLIARKVRESDEPIIRSLTRKNIGRDKKFFDVALAHAKSLQWVVADEDDKLLSPGSAAPA